MGSAASTQALQGAPADKQEALKAKYDELIAAGKSEEEALAEIKASEEAAAAAATGDAKPAEGEAGGEAKPAEGEAGGEAKPEAEGDAAAAAAAPGSCADQPPPPPFVTGIVTLKLQEGGAEAFDAWSKSGGIQAGNGIEGVTSVQALRDPEDPLSIIMVGTFANEEGAKKYQEFRKTDPSPEYAAFKTKLAAPPSPEFRVAKAALSTSGTKAAPGVVSVVEFTLKPEGGPEAFDKWSASDDGMKVLTDATGYIGGFWNLKKDDPNFRGVIGFYDTKENAMAYFKHRKENPNADMGAALAAPPALKLYTFQG